MMPSAPGCARLLRKKCVTIWHDCRCPQGRRRELHPPTEHQPDRTEDRTLLQQSIFLYSSFMWPDDASVVYRVRAKPAPSGVLLDQPHVEPIQMIDMAAGNKKTAHVASCTRTCRHDDPRTGFDTGLSAPQPVTMSVPHVFTIARPHSEREYQRRNEISVPKDRRPNTPALAHVEPVSPSPDDRDAPQALWKAFFSE